MITETQLFTEMLRTARDPAGQTTKAVEWLREQAKTVRAPGKNPQSLLVKNPDRMVTQITVGRMYLFNYDPKMKKELPYYDRYPLVFPFKRVQGGFYAINMHYLPHLLRARLMDGLYFYANNTNKDDTTKLRLSYSLLDRVSKLRFFRPCVKHYLNNHVKSRFLWVPADQWDTALFLPLERFEGATRMQVWQDSKKQITR
ncbi:hypothetical protein EBT25_09420 [bacterium]|nr:hypothetical protein [bacterium]